MSLKGNIYRSTRLPGIHLQMYHWLYFYMAVTCFLHSHSSSPPIEMIQLACQLTFYVQTIHRQINYVSAQKAFLVSDSGSHCFWIKPVLATRTPRHSNTLADTPVEVTNGGGGTCCQAGWPDMAWNTPRKAAWRSRAVWLVRRLGSLIYLSLLYQDTKIVTHPASSWISQPGYRGHQWRRKLRHLSETKGSLPAPL